jgi:transposase
MFANPRVTQQKEACMSGKAATIKLTERQLLVLQRIERSTTAAARLIQRVRIILLGFVGLLNSGIAAEVGLKKSQVGLWRRRWRESFEALTLIECQESAAELERAVSIVLSDAPRSGAPATFSANEVTLILALACEPPGKSGRPIEQWTYRELADEVMKRKIVSSISISQVWRILSEAQLQPHRSKYWLNTTEQDPRVFEDQVSAVCNSYPTQANQPMRIEFEYTRHGTICLIGNGHVVTGQMIAPSVVDCRDEAAFCGHIQQTVAVDPEAKWVFIVDNLNTHNSESLVRYVADSENNVVPESLGRKGRSEKKEPRTWRSQWNAGKMAT